MLVIKVIISVFFMLMLVFPSSSQTRIGGFVEYDNITYFDNGDSDKVNGRNQGILQLELRHQVNSKANFFGSIEIRNDQADRTRDRIYLDEAYINLYTDAFDFRIGKQIFAWGRADGFNPTDNLTSWDYSDFLDTDDEKIGVVSARVDYYLGDWTIEGVMLPSFSESLLPDTQSRWWPELPAALPNPGGSQAGNASVKATYSNSQPLLPGEGLRNMQYALKVARFWKGWDLSLSWFDGYDDLPAIHTDSFFNPDNEAIEITFQNRYHRRRSIGADFATALGKLGLRGEAAYYITEDWHGKDAATDDPYMQYTLGLDYTFRDVLPDRDLFVLLQWIQEVQVPDRNTEYKMTDLNHLFRESLMGKADLSLGEFAKLEIEGVFNLAYDDWWLRPGFEWSVTDGVKLSARADLLGGPNDSFFGLFKQNKRLQTRLKYSF